MSNPAVKRASDVSARFPRHSGPFQTAEVRLPGYVLRAIDEAAAAMGASRGGVVALAFEAWQRERAEDLAERAADSTASRLERLNGGSRPVKGWGDAPIDARYSSHLHDLPLPLK